MFYKKSDLVAGSIAMLLVFALIMNGLQNLKQDSPLSSQKNISSK